MKSIFKCLLGACVIASLPGCGGDAVEGIDTGEGYTILPDGPVEGGGPPGGGGGGGGNNGGGGGAPETDPAAPAEPAAASMVAGTPVPVENGSVAITPATSRIVFVGVHSDPAKPDPRTGGFENFKGMATVVDGNVQSIEVEIDVNSLFTFNPGLTGHLKNADFFETNEFPSAKFVSSAIADGNVTGDLTLHGVTKEVSFPATVMVSDEGMTMAADFTINRFDFEMNGVKDRVNNEVQMKIAVGKATNREEIIGSAGGGGGQRGGGAGRRGGGGGGRGGQGGGRAGFDPMQMFSTQDANADGKLTGDEIPERMRGRLDMIDTNGDGEITKAEMEEMAKRFGGGGRGGAGGGRPGGGGGRPGGGGGRPGGDGGGGSDRPQRPGQ